MAAEKRVFFKSTWLPWVLLAPQLVIVGVFFFWPAGQALVQSLQEQDAFGLSVNWVGLDNFKTLLSDSAYLESFQTTAVFSILVAVLGIALSLGLAVFADRIIRGALVYRTMLIVPYAVAPAVAGVLWVFMFSPSIGVVSYALNHSLGLAVFADRIIRGALVYRTMLIVPYAVAPAVAGVLWVFMFSPSIGVVSYALSHSLGFEWNHLLNSTHAMALIVTAAVWKQISYNFLFFLAGMQSIPKSLIEAAAMDGARPWRRFWTIQFPLLSPTTFFLLVINMVYAFFDTFAIIDATTHGGPGRDTVILVYKVYQDGFKGGDIGGAAAQSVILMIVVVAMTVFQFRYIEKKVNY